MISASRSGPVSRPFGRAGGHPVHVLEIGSAPGPVLSVLTLGATVHRLDVPVADGERRNVVLGHPTVDAHLASTWYLGGTIGRYANRIAHGRVEIDGRPATLGTHDRGHHLHGGPDGFDRRVWDVLHHGSDRVVLGLTSPDGDQGFPGTVVCTATFTVEGDTVSLELAATTDATTLVNLTSHTYLNLDGEGSGTVDRHVLQVPAQRWTPVDDEGIPTGDHAPVDGTAFDLRSPRLVGQVVRQADADVRTARGIDHNLVLDTPGTGTDGLHRAALVTSSTGDLSLELRTDQPGLQVYTGNFLDGSVRGTSGGLYRQGDGMALEPQLFPDSPHHPDWPSAVLRPGEVYRSRMAWHLGVRGAG